MDQEKWSLLFFLQVSLILSQISLHLFGNTEVILKEHSQKRKEPLYKYFEWNLNPSIILPLFCYRWEGYWHDKFQIFTFCSHSTVELDLVYKKNTSKEIQSFCSIKGDILHQLSWCKLDKRTFVSLQKVFIQIFSLLINDILLLHFHAFYMRCNILFTLLLIGNKVQPLCTFKWLNNIKSNFTA